MIEFEVSKDKQSCYGCRVCEQVCPQSAISMEKDEEGFIYPVVDKNKCVDCNLCSIKCPYTNYVGANEIKKVYAVQYKQNETLMESSSGGVFSLFADYIISKGGYVSGCIFDEELTPIHVVSNKKEIINKMRGSKYVQSDTKNIYSDIKEILDAEKMVLFSGTPCQVDGLKKYLGKEYDKLLTLDLICHGVPSSQLLKQYLKSEEKKNGKVIGIKFRDKKLNGWCSQGSLEFRKRIKNISPYNSSYYYYYYLKNCISRYSCYGCRYACVKRVGDITIGDYWNISKLFPTLDTRDGYSVILISTLKGRKAFDIVKEKTFYYETDLKFVIDNNANLVKPSSLPALRKSIYKDIQLLGYDKVAKKECNYKYLVPFLRKYIPQNLKSILKKLRRG